MGKRNLTVQLDDAVIRRAKVTAAKREPPSAGSSPNSSSGSPTPTNATKMPNDAPNERSAGPHPAPPDRGTATTFTAGDRLDGDGLKPVSHECPIDPANSQGERSRLRSSCSSGRPSRSLSRPAYSFDAMMSSSDANSSVSPPTW